MKLEEERKRWKGRNGESSREKIVSIRTKFKANDTRKKETLKFTKKRHQYIAFIEATCMPILYLKTVLVSNSRICLGLFRTHSASCRDMKTNYHQFSNTIADRFSQFWCVFFVLAIFNHCPRSPSLFPFVSVWNALRMNPDGWEIHFVCSKQQLYCYSF